MGITLPVVVTMISDAAGQGIVRPVSRTGDVVDGAGGVGRVHGGDGPSG